jgi:SAM-dependent methyltransferase
MEEDPMIKPARETLFINDVWALAAGKMRSTMFELALEMQVFLKLHDREVTLEELAQLLELPVWSARFMAQFLCREGLLVYSNKKLCNACYINPFLVEENRDLHQLYRVLKFDLPKEKLRQVLLDPPGEKGYQRFTKENHYYGANISRIMWGEQLAKVYSFKGHRVLLDVAGASGGFIVGIRKHNPHLRGILFELPDAEEFARQCVEEAGEGEFIRFVAGSFLIDDLPRGADIALLSHVVHNWPLEQNLIILSKIFEALEPGGTLLVKEAFFEDDWTGPIEPLFLAYFMGRDTWQPTYGEVEAMMAQVGFVDLERRFEIHDGLVIGRKSPL